MDVAHSLAEHVVLDTLLVVPPDFRALPREPVDGQLLSLHRRLIVRYVAENALQRTMYLNNSEKVLW
uniref:Uncharacterized protein n=1 Tax=Caenorhabditis japonica TaxID=281687 RepID=A0A8R1IK23_CAEJA